MVKTTRESCDVRQTTLPSWHGPRLAAAGAGSILQTSSNRSMMQLFGLHAMPQ